MTVPEGDPATFTVTATGTGTLLYQWKKGVTDIASATSASYATPATVLADNGAQFTCVVTDEKGSATSGSATLTVNMSTEDTDGDGLPDSWETLYGLDPDKQDSDGNGILDPNEDPDGDGYSNLQEYLNNTNPNVSNKEETGAFCAVGGAQGWAVAAPWGMLWLCVLGFAAARVRRRS